jgi:endoglucanase
VTLCLEYLIVPSVRNSASAYATALIFAVTILFAQGQSARAETAFDCNKKLGSGINLGNALEAPKEGDWGVVLQAEYFPLIKAAGFSHVRLPVSWSTHAGLNAPYTIEPAFIERVDWAIKQARANGLVTVLNMHHYNELEADPAAHSQRFISMWQQIAEHLRNDPDDLVFEFYNEPAKKIDAAKWNSLFAQTLKTVRASNPRRFVVVGPVVWNSIDQLNALELPDDKNLLVTVHYYQPMNFTHQGADWIGPESKKWLGTKWTGSPKEVAEMTADFDKAAEWGSLHARPMYLGEFGAYEKADMDSRVLWTKAVRAQAKRNGFSDAYWEFCSGFGAYDPTAKEWRKPLLDALKTPSK